jgi:hypothetical protein
MPRPRFCLIALACSALFLGTLVGEDAKNTTPAATPADIERLIKQLGDDDFDKREAASRALEAIGEPAREALLRAAIDRDDAEVRRRAEKLAKALELKQSFTGHRDDVLEVAFSPEPTPSVSSSYEP